MDWLRSRMKYDPLSGPEVAPSVNIQKSCPIRSPGGSEIRRKPVGFGDLPPKCPCVNCKRRARVCFSNAVISGSRQMLGGCRMFQQSVVATQQLEIQDEHWNCRSRYRFQFFQSQLGLTPKQRRRRTLLKRSWANLFLKVTKPSHWPWPDAALPGQKA